ncbi:hypothetical protein DOY81_013601, partial [Sarcophaga bullata]
MMLYKQCTVRVIYYIQAMIRVSYRIGNTQYPDKVEELFRCDDVVQAMYCEGDILYTGDDKGVVSNWENDKMVFKYNLVEEVKGLAVEQ